MAVVGAREEDAELLVDVEQPVVGDALVLQPVGLQFEIIIVLAENLAILACRLWWRRPIFLSDEIGDFPLGQPEGRSILRGAVEESLYPSVAYNKTFKIGFAHKLDEVLVSLRFVASRMRW